MARLLSPARYKQPNVWICLASVVLVCIILAVLVFFIVWLSVQPKKLRYSIVHASISDYNLTDSGHLNADLRLVLRAQNPNRDVSFYYDRINATVNYENQQVCTGEIPRFYQPRRNVTDLEVELEAKDAAVSVEAARDLRKEKPSGIVGLEVKLDAKIRIKIGAFKVHRNAKVGCGPVSVPVASSGKRFEKVSCDVDVDF